MVAKEPAQAASPSMLTTLATQHLRKQSPRLSASRRVTPTQMIATLGCLAALALGLALWPVRTIIALNVIFVFHCLTVFILRAGLLYLSATRRDVSHSRLPAPKGPLPIVSILCPMFKEAESLPKFVGALMALDYPTDRLEICLLLEEDDDETIAAANELALPSHFNIIRIPPSQPRTKPKACNYALWQVIGDLVVIYDAEDRPEPQQLRKAAAQFETAPEEVCCLQARLNYYNRDETILTRLFAVEYALLFDLILPGLSRINAPLPLGGTSNIFKKDALLKMGGWDPHNVTEDADLGLRMVSFGYTSQVLDSTTYEEATAKVRPWIRQRSRWIKGYLQTWLVHCRRSPTPRTWPFFVTLHLLIATVIVAALFNPIYWFLYGAWLFGAEWVQPLFPAPLDAVATFTLLAGNLFHIWMFMLAPMHRRWHDLVPYAFLAPFYWLLQTAAGVVALWQFFVKPFHWEKTNHGPGQSLEEALGVCEPTS